MDRSSIVGMACLSLLTSGLGSGAWAQTAGYDWYLVVPVIAQTGSYQSFIYVHNPATQAVELQVGYNGGTGSATPGATNCPSLPVPANTSVSASLTDICPSLAAGANFGALRFWGAQAGVYTRVQTPTGNGFSVEGLKETFPSCGNSVFTVLGLIRQAAPPTFQSNCFLWNRETRAARVVVTLASGDGTLIADDIVELAGDEFLRMLDVFAAVGAPAGDYANARASFESIVPIGGGSPVNVLTFCTVQNNTSFDADFRIGKCQQW